MDYHFLFSHRVTNESEGIRRFAVTRSVYLFQLHWQHMRIYLSETIWRSHSPMPEYIFNFSALSLVAIYLGIKKRPSPGPSDVAGIWEAVGGGTLRRSYWLCGRQHLVVAARSIMLAPFCSLAPMAWQGATSLLRPRYAIFPRAPQRLLTGCATHDSGGHH